MRLQCRAILQRQSHRFIIGKYRKVHLPGHSEYDPSRDFQHLEKRYFLPGDLGFPVYRSMRGILGMCICNDRRWPETYRVMGLQDVELVMLGYNTPLQNPPAPEHDHLTSFHNLLSMQSGAYQNATWVVGVAKAGIDALTRYMAGVGGNKNIRVNCIRPGQIMTPGATRGTVHDPDGGHHVFESMFDLTQIIPGPGYPKDVANLVLFLVSEDSRFITSEIINIDGGVAAKI